jgi:uncharacterized coiled-coil DUF342 family protein
MKKRIITLAMIVTLLFGLAVTAFAAPSDDNASGTFFGMTSEQRDEFFELRLEILDNRTTLLTLKTENIQLGKDLRDLLNEIKGNDEYVITQENLDTLHALADELDAKRDELAATVGDITALLDSYRDYRQSRDVDSALQLLEQIVAVQENRIAIKTDIGDILGEMIAIAEAA